MSNLLVVSDIHGHNPKLEQELEKIADSNDLPKIVVFLGDIVGTNQLDTLQKKFYNLFNKMKKNEGVYDRGIALIMGQEILELINYLNSLSDINFSQPIVKFAEEVARYQHFGHFCSNLPWQIREKLKAELVQNATKIISIMTKFTNKGSLVVIIEGNWDARTPLDFYQDKVKCIPIPPDERGFYFKDLVISLNPKILYVDELSKVKTEDYVYVLLPFDEVINLTQIPGLDEDEKDKPAILLSHVQADWEAVKGDTPMTNEGKIIATNMQKIIDSLQPAAIIHGHLHDHIDNNGYMLPNDTPVHYLPLGTCRIINNFCF